MSKKIIYTEQAPKAIGPYSQGVVVNGMLFLSGQISIDPTNNELMKGELKDQAELVMKNIEALLRAAGTDFSQVIKTSIFLAPGEDFETVNEVYASYFQDGFPARETIWVNSLPKNVKVEISMIAKVDRWKIGLGRLLGIFKRKTLSF